MFIIGSIDNLADLIKGGNVNDERPGEKGPGSGQRPWVRVKGQSSLLCPFTLTPPHPFVRCFLLVF